MISIRVNLTPAEADELTKAAKRSCMTVRIYLGNAALEKARHENKVAAQVAEALRATSFTIVSPGTETKQ